jgi:hypothetical protein
MDPTQPNSQAAEQQWLEPPTPSQHDKFLEQRIEELEQQVAAYDALLNELPDLFERKFQERLAPILERYQLLSEQQQKNAAAADTPFIAIHPIPGQRGAFSRDQADVFSQTPPAFSVTIVSKPPRDESAIPRHK